MARTLEEIIKNEKPEVAAQAKAKANAILLNIRLSEIRELMNKTQSDIAATLGVTQPTVAGMEKAGQDLKLSSLKRYVEAAGGRVTVDIELPNGERHGFAL